MDGSLGDAEGDARDLALEGGGPRREVVRARDERRDGGHAEPEGEVVGAWREFWIAIPIMAHRCLLLTLQFSSCLAM